MKEIFDHHPEVVIDPAEYARLLGYPVGHELRDRAKELAELTEEWYKKHGKPWVYVRKATSLELAEELFFIDKIEFKSKAVLERFHNGEAEDVFLMAVGAGKECEERAHELWKESKPDEYFFMEMYGSAVVENLVMQTSAKLCAWADENSCAILPHYSPGYNQWDIREQLSLIQLIQNGNQTGHHLLIESLDSGMLKPKKSLLAIFGVTKKPSNLTVHQGMIPCVKCALKNCQYRRKPYRFSKSNQQQSKVNRKLENSANTMVKEEKKYSLSLKVLKKWTEERLTINTAENDTIKASFIYDGTTCSNFGFPLKFEYSITLMKNSNEHVILESDCRPVEGDIGYQKMCQYIKQGDPLLKIVQEEKPLSGTSLESLFEKEISFNPSGCYCDQKGREYKWNLVLQVLHYALNNN